MSTNYLHALSSKQLISILKHVQYGHQHLSTKLKKDEYRNLCSLGSLSNNQIAKLESDKQEKIGNVCVVVNTILTSCFGAWLGFNGFNETSIISPFGILIILAGISFGVMTGYLSYLFTYRQEKLARKNQELSNVKRVLTEIIINKRKSKIEAVQQRVYSILNRMNLVGEHNQDTSPHRIYEVLRTIPVPAQQDHFHSLFKKLFSSIKRNIRKLNAEHRSKKVQTESSFNSTDFLLNNSLTSASYIRTLTKSEVMNKSQIPKVNTWLRSNLGGIAVGLLPTFLGSFASMFVFLNGFPAMLQGLEIEFGFSPITVAHLKTCGLLIALSLSIYFAYSHIHSNYKSYKRVKQLEISENVVDEMTNQMLQLTYQLNTWYKIFYQLELIESLRSHELYAVEKVANKV